MTTGETSASEAAATPRWQPLEPNERRVLGVLVEKAKTTPENYPLSLNALRNGCNQKNNRSPLTQLVEEQVEDALESLRKLGAAIVIQGDGRVEKHRHRAYEWLGVEKTELAVMAELLLRGAQTIGELRGRAARMEPIKDLGELRPVLDALEAKRLIMYLTPPGRGCVVSHALYQDRELDKIRREAAAMHGDALSSHEDEATPAHVGPKAVAAPAQRNSDVRASGWEAEVAQLRGELAELKREFQAARDELTSTAAELRRGLDELNRQLGN
ncbi:MAG TPA: DUF480 domain-containing protein [Lacipirellulaceae bacterium]|jgi:hypothetical protein